MFYWPVLSGSDDTLCEGDQRIYQYESSRVYQCGISIETMDPSQLPDELLDLVDLTQEVDIESNQVQVLALDRSKKYIS